MFAVVLMMAMGLGLSALDQHVRGTAIRTTSEIASRIAADAGLEKSVFEMNEQLKIRPWDDSTLPYTIHEKLPSCDASFTFQVDKDGKGGYAVQSIGSSGRMRKRVGATLGLSGVFNHTILTRGSLKINNDVTVEGYNSEDPLDTDVDVKVATTTTEKDAMELRQNVQINGDILVGVGGDPDAVIKDTGATVTGSRRAMPVELPFPEVTAPSLIYKGGGLKIKGKTLQLGPADSGEYSYIDLDPGTADSILEVGGGQVVMHVTGDIKLAEGSEITVKPDASLQLYVDGDIVCAKGSGIGYQGSPEKPKCVQLYATGKDDQNFDLKAKGHWSGVVYAPNADVDLFAQGDVYGSFVTYTLEVKNSGKMHYDKALKNVDTDDIGVRFVVKRWSED